MRLTEVIASPEWNSDVVLTKRYYTLGIDGDIKLTEEETPERMLVLGIPKDDLKRMPEGSVAESSIKVYWKGELTIGRYDKDSLGYQRYSDLIKWEGDRYQVVSVQKRYRKFGYTCAICSLYGPHHV